ncbi:ubiquinol-cytochrome c reductase iron-sulfur subunit [Thiohalorhabdus sp.]|uniref:ubiquinol-cytochrome c reductase iron-sulfur subunit n=1 Tax=Thiohalorhabdus sp. TaxID=3094134 RepID=UPI002FC2D5D7
MSTDSVNPNRRRILNWTAGVVGAVGVGYAAVPFIRSMSPSAAVQAKATKTVDLTKIEPGQRITVSWQGKPVWIVRRTPEMLETLEDPAVVDQLKDPDSSASEQPDFAANPHRSREPEWLVMVAICTHLGCIPSYNPEPGGDFWSAKWEGGFFCPCHGSGYDFSGRVMAGSPAPRNMAVPFYEFLSDSELRIGKPA